MDNPFRNTIKWHVIDRLKRAGLDNTPDNRWQILEDLRQEALRSSVVVVGYRQQIDTEIDWNNYAIETLDR